MEVFVGIDFGTSGCRACAIDHNQQLVAQTSTGLPEPYSTQVGGHQQDPGIWWDACLRVLDQLFNDKTLKPVAISVDGTSGTLLLANALGEPLTPALMYNDQRSADQARSLGKIAPDNSAVLSPSSALAKLMYLEQAGYGRHADHALHQADWIAGKLTNVFGISDENNTLKLGYDPVNRIWPEWLKDCSFSQDLLPRVVPVGERSGFLQKSLLKRWRCSSPVAIIAGTTDSNAATLASGIQRAGEAVTSLGSTLVLKVLSDTPVFSSSHGIYSHRMGSVWLAGGASNTGGQVLKKFFTAKQMQNMSDQLSPQEPTGLDYYPLTSQGERFPNNSPGLQPRLSPRPTDDVQFFQGMLESIARIEHQGYLKLQELGAPYPTRVYSSGGGAQNHRWTEIRKTVLQTEVNKAFHTEACYGSALIASGKVF